MHMIRLLPLHQNVTAHRDGKAWASGQDESQIVDGQAVGVRVVAQYVELVGVLAYHRHRKS